jgi:hypothetical protein
MQFNMIYKKKKDWFIGHIQQYPDYESQGRSLDELRDNLVEIYNDIDQGLVPDAEPFQLMKVAVLKETRSYPSGLGLF